jgi:hypothetical protein
MSHSVQATATLSVTKIKDHGGPLKTKHIVMTVPIDDDKNKYEVHACHRKANPPDYSRHLLPFTTQINYRTVRT